MWHFAGQMETVSDITYQILTWRSLFILKKFYKIYKTTFSNRVPDRSYNNFIYFTYLCCFVIFFICNMYCIICNTFYLIHKFSYSSYSIHFWIILFHFCRSCAIRNQLRLVLPWYHLTSAFVAYFYFSFFLWIAKIQPW